MLPPLLGVPALAVGLVSLLWLIGSGPAMLLLPRGGSRALAPALGLALSIALLTTIAAVTPLRIAGPVTLVGLAAVSATVAVRAAGSVRALFAHVDWVAFGLVVVGIALGALPVLLHGTYGPVNLHFMDSWFYVGADEFLQAHRYGDAVDGTVSTAPSMGVVAAIQNTHGRMGVDALQGAYFALTSTSPIAGQYAAQAALVGIVPLTVYGLARSVLGLTRPIATLAGLVAVLSPVTAQLWTDPRPANLVVVTLGPAALMLAARGAAGRGWRDHVLAGVCAAAAAVTYTEHGPTLVLAGGIAALVLIAGAERRRGAALGVAQAAAIAVLTALVVSGPGIIRAVEYITQLSSAAGGPPIEGLRGRTLPALEVGAVHLYELFKIPLLAPWKATALYLVVFLVLVLCVVGAVARRRGAGAGPAAVPLALLVAGAMLAMYFRVTDSTCGYCVSKAVTLSGPAFALALALGVSAVLASSRGGTAVRSILVVGVGAYLLLAARGTFELERAAARLPFAVEQEELAIPGAIRALPGRAPVFVEGAEQAGDIAGFFDAPATLNLADRNGHPLSYDASLNGFLSGVFPGDTYRPDYRWILSRYPGLRASSRRPLRRLGEYSLLERLPGQPDAAFVGAIALRDPKDHDSTAIPWARGPFVLRLSGMTQPRTLHLRVIGDAAAGTAWAADSGRVRQRRVRGGATVCVSLPRGPEVRDVTLIPQGLNAPMPPRRPTVPLQRAPRAIGIQAISFADTAC